MLNDGAKSWGIKYPDPEYTEVGPVTSKECRALSQALSGDCSQLGRDRPQRPRAAPSLFSSLLDLALRIFTLVLDPAQRLSVSAGSLSSLC